MTKDELYNALVDTIIDEIRGFKSETITEGNPDPYIDDYADGANKGYNDAVAQIVEHFERMKVTK